MQDISTTYLGLPLKNPIVISSSSLTGTIEGIRKAAASGAGALVLKSLFEEQISADLDAATAGADMYSHPEAAEYLQGLGKQLGPRDYLDLISKAKQELAIPIIASINCVSQHWWGEYGTQLSVSGADAVELNVSVMPRALTETSDAIEHYILAIVEKAGRVLNIPFSVKIGPYFTALPQFATRIARAGAKGLVLFNRFYRFDIDIEKLSLIAGVQFSSAQEYNTALRWISILHGHAPLDLSGSTGVHDAATVIKMLLAGASTVQISSAVFKYGYGIVQTMLSGLESWMEQHGFANLRDLIGHLSQGQSEQPELYERLQYIKALTAID